MNNPNLDILIQALFDIGPLANEMVFVGGCATALLITDPAATGIRETTDVDVLIEASTYAEYQSFADRLKAEGFREDTRDDAPICRWIKNTTVLDMMALDEAVLGFNNAWYRSAKETAIAHELPNRKIINLVDSVHFCATKLEAFVGRGNGDFISSHDLEDISAVVDGRSQLLHEVADAKGEIRNYVAAGFDELVKTSRFLDALPGHLSPDDASQRRLPQLIERYLKIASLNTR
jgi:hypothetical protein